MFCFAGHSLLTFALPVGCYEKLCGVNHLSLYLLYVLIAEGLFSQPDSLLVSQLLLI